MKKTIAFLLTGLLLIGVLSFGVCAADYTAFNLVFEEKEGEKVNETRITVFASVDDGDMTDRTGEFTLEGVEWFRYLSEPEAGKTADDYDYADEELKIYGYLCSDEDTFDHDSYRYFLRIARLYAGEEDSFARNVRINGVDVEELQGLCFNTGNEFFIKTVTNGSGGSSPDREETTDRGTVNGTVEDGEEKTGKDKCRICGICPFRPLGICLFLWLAILLLAVIVIVVCVGRKRKGSEKKK